MSVPGLEPLGRRSFSSSLFASTVLNTVLARPSITHRDGPKKLIGDQFPSKFKASETNLRNLMKPIQDQRSVHHSKGTIRRSNFNCGVFPNWWGRVGFGRGSRGSPSALARAPLVCTSSYLHLDHSIRRPHTTFKPIYLHFHLLFSFKHP